MTQEDSLQVRGEATDDEIAAVIAALRERADQTLEPESNYERWRRQRLAALRSR